MGSILFLSISGIVCIVVSGHRLPKLYSKYKKGELKSSTTIVADVMLILLGLVLLVGSHLVPHEGRIKNIMTPEDLKQEIHRVDGLTSNTSHGTLVPLVDGKNIPYAVMNPDALDPKTSYVKKIEVMPGEWTLVDANYVEPTTPLIPTLTLIPIEQQIEE